MKRLFKITFIVSILLSNLLFAQTIIKGVVKDVKEKPLAFVNVYILNSLEGAMTNDKGEFSFRTSQKGEVELIASLIGYKKKTVKINMGKIKSGFNIILETTSVKLKEAVVMGSSYSNEKAKGLVISTVDVYTTPGGAADLFQSLKTMPGVTNVSESAELYVRGGNSLETVTIIDQATVYHPYTYESSYGGLFSNLNTSAMKSMYFSSGGFSVKYGNILSGILDVETKSQPITTSFNIGISLAATSVSAELPIVENKLGIRIYAKKSYTQALMWLNGDIDGFSAAPTSQDVTSILTYNYSKTGKIKFVNTLSSDAQGVNVDRAEYSGIFDGNSSGKFFNLQHSDIIFNNIVLKSSASLNLYQNRWKLGALDLTKHDNVFKIRSDLESILSNRLKLSVGVEFERRSNSFEGTIPEVDYDIRPDADTKYLNTEISGKRFGGYIEFTLNDFLLNNLHAIGGIRSDYFPELKQQNFDPRFGLIYKLAKNSSLKAMWGIYHQSPDLRFFSYGYSNSNLKSMQAVHYQLSFDTKTKRNNSFRIDFYYKDYSSLPLESSHYQYTNNGFGYAYGADLILKGKLPFNFSGWISYGYLNTKRKWMNYKELTRSEYDITHGISLILKYNINAMWQIGVNFKYSTGRPYTPIIDGELIESKNIYEPVYGEINSEKYPDYKRLDFRVTHFRQLFGNNFTVFYIEALNILNINNLFDYSYSFNYKIKKPVKSYFGRRTIVVGMNMQI